MSLEDFLSKTVIIQSNFGNTQVSMIGHFIKPLIQKLNSSILNLYVLASCLGTSAKKTSVTISYPARK